MFLHCKGVCTSTKSRSAAPVFRKIKIGDIYDFSLTLKSPGRGQHTYATYVKCVNERTGIEGEVSLQVLGKILERFEFKEIE